MSDTVISFLLDRSGSMASVKDDVIGGFNEFLRKQKEGPDVKFVLTLFDTQGIDEQVFSSVKDVPELTDSSYIPRGGTPLLDAIGKTIKAAKQQARREGDKVLFVIYTDGEENSSTEFTKQKIKQKIEKKQGKGWEFLFLGVDMDAYEEAAQYGIARQHTYNLTSAGTQGSMGAVATTATRYSQTGTVDSSLLDAEEKRQAQVNS